MAQSGDFELVVSDAPAVGLTPASAEYWLKQAALAAGAGADVVLHGVSTKVSGLRRFGPLNAAMKRRLVGAQEMKPYERSRLSTKWYNFEDFAAKWVCGGATGGRASCFVQGQRTC
jgi:hypothetical protein